MNCANGCSSFRIGQRIALAHRAVWELTHGAIPVGLRVLHRCDNPPCCNPNHLFLRTQADNVADCMAKGRAVIIKGETHYGARLTKCDVEMIRASKLSVRELASLFGVNKANINLIKARKAWKHVH
jgi:Autographiviridae endonuclease